MRRPTQMSEPPPLRPIAPVGDGDRQASRYEKRHHDGLHVTATAKGTFNVSLHARDYGREILDRTGQNVPNRRLGGRLATCVIPSGSPCGRVSDVAGISVRLAAREH